MSQKTQKRHAHTERSNEKEDKKKICSGKGDVKAVNKYEMTVSNLHPWSDIELLPCETVLT